jgi:hypothetical protein
MELVRRCRDCKRIVRGHAGDACPYCGGSQLISVVLQATGEIKHHPSVVTAAVTFCLGLVLLRIVAAFIGPRLSVAYMMTGELLTNLQLLVAVCTVVYVILRRSEGDFRALFIVSLGLFAATEGLGALARGYGVLTLDGIATLFNLTLFMYASLALTASLADGPRKDFHQRALTFASLGFVLLASMRTIFEMRTGSTAPNDRQNFATTIVIFTVAAYIALLVIRGETTGRREAAAHEEPPRPEAPAELAAGNGNTEPPPSNPQSAPQ